MYVYRVPVPVYVDAYGTLGCRLLIWKGRVWQVVQVSLHGSLLACSDEYMFPDHWSIYPKDALKQIGVIKAGSEDPNQSKVVVMDSEGYFFK